MDNPKAISISASNNIQGKIKNWFKDPHNIAIVAIMLAAFTVRLYYFFQTTGQTLWWDEAEYMATAKHWAFGVPYEVNPQRPPLFQFFASLILRAGLGEQVIKFALVLIPSLAFVYVTYLLGKEMYNKRIGIIASLLAAISWTLLFWTERMQPDSFSILFQVLAVYFMWKYWKGLNENNPASKFSILAGIFAALGFYFKVSALLVPAIFLIFILIKDRLSAFKRLLLFCPGFPFDISSIFFVVLFNLWDIYSIQIWIFKCYWNCHAIWMV
jgi:4-amino-4-deoxy-L-arabinose transferase-like glycosyltransferase